LWPVRLSSSADHEGVRPMSSRLTWRRAAATSEGSIYRLPMTRRLARTSTLLSLFKFLRHLS
jgi:hypothetical protein